ncbi:hypothetical protein BDF21DRAFT_337793, partial [Thamnidium elegans]
LFFNRNLAVNKVLYILFMWVKKAPQGYIVDTIGCFHQTVRKVINGIQQVIQEDLSMEDDLMIEIDESKFGKRKHNRSHRVEGVWVIGGVERTPERKVFVITAQQPLRAFSTHIQNLVKMPLTFYGIIL